MSEFEIKIKAKTNGAECDPTCPLYLPGGVCAKWGKLDGKSRAKECLKEGIKAEIAELDKILNDLRKKRVARQDLLGRWVELWDKLKTLDESEGNDG